MYNYINGVNSLSASTRAAGSGVGCTRSVNNAALDSRTQFSRDVEAPQAKCEETVRAHARKIPVISRRGYTAEQESTVVYGYNVFLREAILYLK